MKREKGVKTKSRGMEREVPGKFKSKAILSSTDSDSEGERLKISEAQIDRYVSKLNIVQISN